MSAWAVEKRHGDDWRAGRAYATEAEARAVADGLVHTETRVVERRWMTATAAQEPSDAETLAALNAWLGGADFDGPDSLDEYSVYDVRDMRAALRAAARVRQEADG